MVAKHQLRVEQEAAVFGEDTGGPLYRQSIEHSEHSSSLTTADEGGIGGSCRSPLDPGALVRARLTCGSEGKPVLLRFSSHVSSSLSVLPSSPGCARCRDPFPFCGVGAVLQTAGYECGCPKLPVVSGPVHLSTLC